MSVISNWLTKVGAASCADAFSQHGIDDFFCIPFVRPEVLSKMGISGDDERKIMEDVTRLRALDSTACTLMNHFEFCVTHFDRVVVALWLEFLGYGKYAARFQKEKIRISVRRSPFYHSDFLIDVQTLRLLTVELLAKLGVEEADCADLFEHIEYFHYFSSAEGSHCNLRVGSCACRVCSPVS